MNGCLLGFIVFVLVLPWPATAAECFRGSLVGEVTHVRDGDTIELGAKAIRFEGDRSAGGEGARRRSGHGSQVAVCYLDGVDIEAIVVRNGFARDCPRYSGGRHAEAERRAAADGATIQQSYRLPGYCRRR